MAERPSTSDGPGARDPGGNQFRFDNMNFSKRISRDDSFLNTKGHAGADFRPFRNPRARQVTADLSPQSTTPASGHLAVPTIRMPTLEEGAEIGMALGSPGQAANWHTWDSPSAQKSRRAVSPAPSRMNGAKPSEAPAPKKQPGKWRLFGMFGRKQPDQPTPNVPVAGSNEPRGSEQRAAVSQSRTAAPQSRTAAKLERSVTSASRKTPKHKPLVVRTNTMPFEEDVATVYQPKSRDNRLEDERTLGTIPIALDGLPSVERGTAPPAKGSVATGPMLNVEIPTVELERYSVMFSSVLDKPSSSNLLARRQATLQQLRHIDDAMVQGQGSKQSERYRRASSPQPGASPTFDQFPTPPSGQEIQGPPHKLSPHVKRGGLTRSNTSPAMLHSPLRHAYDSPSTQSQPSPDNKQSTYNHLRDPAKGNPKGKLTIATLAKTRREQAAPKPHRFDPEVSSLILESPTDSDTASSEGEVKSPELIHPEIFRSQAPQAPEPKWEMVNPLPLSQQAPSTASSSVSSRKGSPSSSASSAKTNTTLPSSQSSVHDDSEPPVPEPDDDDDDDDIVITKDMNPVEVSIARQISLSRQQRRMLRPLQTGGRSTPRPIREAPSRTGTASRQSPVQVTPATKMAMGKNERMAETKSSMPNLVIPAPDLDPQSPQNRKSERIILEAA